MKQIRKVFYLVMALTFVLSVSLTNTKAFAVEIPPPTEEPWEVPPDLPTEVIAGPEPGSSYTYVGKTSNHSIAYFVTKETFSYILGAGITTKKPLAQWAAGKVFSSLTDNVMGALEPTQYSKIYVSPVSESSPYQATIKYKYYWFEDSKYNTYKTETSKTQVWSCSNYTPYCWK